MKTQTILIDCKWPSKFPKVKMIKCKSCQYVVQKYDISWATLLYLRRILTTFKNAIIFFRSSWSTADLLTVVSDTIVRAFNRSGATRPQALYISKAFDRVLYAGLLYKLKSCEISGQKFGLFRLENFRFEILSFLSNRRL